MKLYGELRHFSLARTMHPPIRWKVTGLSEIKKTGLIGLVRRLGTLLLAAILIMWPAPYLTANCQAVASCAGATVTKRAQMASDPCCCPGLGDYCERAGACGIGQTCDEAPAPASAAEAGPATHIASDGTRATRLAADWFRVSSPPDPGPPADTPIPPFIALHAFLI